MRTLLADDTETGARERSLAIAVPEATAIARLLQDLLGLKVAVEPIELAAPQLDEHHVLACYADGAEELRALVLLDLSLSLGIGGALAELPMPAIDAALAAKALSAEAFRRVHDALSAFSVLFDSGVAGQVKLVGLNRADELAAAGIMRLLESAWTKVTYAVDVFGYPVGALSVFMGGANRRGGLRICHRAQAEIRFDTCVGVRKTWDISSGGLYVGEPDPPHIGTIGRVVLSLEGVRPLQFQGRVAWRSARPPASGLPPGFGIQLLTTPGPEQDLFQTSVLHLVRRAAQQAAGAPTVQTAGPQASQAHGSGPILIVDHTQYVRAQVATCLARAGYATMVAADGIEALEKLRRTSVRMVVCEVNMPRMNGIEFLENIPRHDGWPTVPVLMLTSEAEPLLVRRAKTLGARGWLMKPVQPQVLVAAVRRFLGERDAPVRA